MGALVGEVLTVTGCGCRVGLLVVVLPTTGRLVLVTTTGLDVGLNVGLNIGLDVGFIVGRVVGGGNGALVTFETAANQYCE